MSDQRGIELVNASLDRALTPEESSELAQRLAASDSLRQLQQELTQVDRMLTEAPQAGLPDGLHERIVERVQLPKTSASPRRWQMPGFLRYGLAAAAGLVVAVGLYELTPPMPADIGVDGMTGTVVPPASGNAIIIDRFTFSRDGTETSASLEDRDGVLVLNVDMRSRDAASLDLHVTDSGLSFGALSQADSRFESFELSDQRIVARGRGRQQFTVLVKRNRAPGQSGEARIGLKLKGSGGWTHEGQLALGEFAEDQIHH